MLTSYFSELHPRDEVAIQNDDTLIKIEASLEHAGIESPWTTCYKRESVHAEKVHANGPQMSPLVHNLYKKIADLEHGIELRELESKMAVKSPRSSEVFSNEKSKAPRVMSPTVIHPMGRGQTAQQKYESNMTMESENNHLLDKVESLEYQLACEQRDKLKMQREIDNLAEKLSRALVGPEPSTQSFELQRQLSMEKSYSEDLKGKLASAGIQIKEQQRLLDSMTETLASLQKENDALRFSVQELEMKLVRAASDDTMSRTMQELYAKCAAMERRLAEVPALERQVSDASRQLEEERSRASKVQRELVEIRRDLARSDHEAQDQRSKAGAATAEVTQLRQELDRQAHRLHEQSRKADAATQDAAAARSELRQFREKVSAHQTKWRSERHTLMVSNQTRPHRYDRKRTCSCRFPMVAEPALLTPRSLSTAPLPPGHASDWLASTASWAVGEAVCTRTTSLGTAGPFGRRSRSSGRRRGGGRVRDGVWADEAGGLRAQAAAHGRARCLRCEAATPRVCMSKRVA